LREETLRELLEAVSAGRVEPAEAVDRLRTLPFEDLSFAKVDHHRAIRTGFPEVIYSPGKTLQQIEEIAGKLYHASDAPVLATRAAPEAYEAMLRATGDAAYYDVARIAVAGPGRVRPKANHATSYVGVVCAGTADMSVAEEAAVTLESAGDRVERLYDVGVAGLHRLLGNLDALVGARVLVVVAGMEGALPSVVAGLVACPVIAVPTSIGYGASLGGLAPLLAMLNSCSTGVAVVNIDNGFGAAAIASLINKDDPR
jgi:hypothetical protein